MHYLTISSFLVFLEIFDSGMCTMSSFLLTKTLNENKRCTMQHMKRQHADSSIGCAELCLVIRDCRRFMFDLISKFCYFYKVGENCYSENAHETKMCYRLRYICNTEKCTRCPMGYYGNRCENIIKDCCDGSKKSVIPITTLSYIQPSSTGSIKEVYCYSKYGLCETFIYRRRAKCIEADFNRTWDEYLNGFGNALGEYWIGLKTMYEILRNGSMNLKGYTPSMEKTLRYDNAINMNHPETGYGMVSTGMTFYGMIDITGMPFSTYDRDLSGHNCPQRFGSGWWYLNSSICSTLNVLGKNSSANQNAEMYWNSMTIYLALYKEKV